MRIRVLGCNGGIGPKLRTTSLLINDNILVDCGTGVGELTREEMSKIRHIFITHAHLDHIAFIPFLVDSVFNVFLEDALTIHLQVETRDLLQKHIFNGEIWPNYLRIPDKEHPVLQYDLMDTQQQIKINDDLIEAIPVTHMPGAVGYRLQSSTGRSFAYSGDTKSTDLFWKVLNTYSGLDVLIIECAYPDYQVALGEIAGHHRPTTLAADLRKLEHQAELYIMHQKPGEEDSIMRELAVVLNGRVAKSLQRDQVFEL